MWIALNDAFFSIVALPTDKETLVVRARMEEDIERVFGIPLEDQIVDAGTDYKYRVYLPRLRVAKVIQNEVESINYNNFKDSVPHRYEVDRKRAKMYGEMWSTLYNWQTDRYGYSDWWTNYRDHKV